ncbi:YaaA family protein [Hydrogenimonas sp.]
MTILFAPSEGKRPGGALPPIDPEAFFLPELFDKRMEAVDRYRRFVENADESALMKLFGVKEPSLMERWRHDVAKAPTMEAVLRYDGVAYDHLDYPTLPSDAQAYVKENLVIFSNLFGPVKGGDRLPDYKLKQGESIGDFRPERFYKAHFSNALEAYLRERGPIVDLRAGFYEKFFKLTLPHITMKFLKNGKSVSHWAKAYRGRVVRRMAEEGVETIEGIEALQIEGLRIVEILQSKNAKTFVYEILA